MGIPLALKPWPEMLMLSIVTAEAVVFVKLSVTVLLSPMGTLPKLMLDAFALNVASVMESASALPFVGPEQPDW